MIRLWLSEAGARGDKVKAGSALHGQAATIDRCFAIAFSAESVIAAEPVGFEYENCRGVSNSPMSVHFFVPPQYLSPEPLGRVGRVRSEIERATTRRRRLTLDQGCHAGRIRSGFS